MSPSDDFPLPRIRSIEGRKLDVIKTPDGRLLPGEFFPHLLKDFSAIRKFQIIQNTLSSLEIKIQKKGDFPDAEYQSLLNIVRGHVGNDIKIEVSFVDQIELTSSGKHRVTVSNIK